MLRRVLFQLHLWTGIGVGLYVVLISLTGSIVVFRREVYTFIQAGYDRRRIRSADDRRRPDESGGSTSTPVTR